MRQSVCAVSEEAETSARNARPLLPAIILGTVLIGVIADDGRAPFTPAGRMAPDILAWIEGFLAQGVGGLPHPMRIEDRRPGERDHVGLSRTENGFGLMRIADLSDGYDGDFDGALHLSRKAHLIARPVDNPLSGDSPPLDICT